MRLIARRKYQTGKNVTRFRWEKSLPTAGFPSIGTSGYWKGGIGFFVQTKIIMEKKTIVVKQIQQNAQTERYDSHPRCHLFHETSVAFAFFSQTDGGYGQAV